MTKKGLMQKLKEEKEDAIQEQALIVRFTGKYEFLSNFCKAPFSVFETKTQSVTYQTVEHAYQSRKTDDLRWRANIIRAWTGAVAKKLGSKAPMIPDWDKKKVAIMERYLLQKFHQHPELAKKLVDTGRAVLIEGNTWGDRFWGMTNDGFVLAGMNVLGGLLMRVRSDERTIKLARFFAKHPAHGLSIKVLSGKPIIHGCGKCKKICVI